MNICIDNQEKGGLVVTLHFLILRLAAEEPELIVTYFKISKRLSLVPTGLRIIAKLNWYRGVEYPGTCIVDLHMRTGRFSHPRSGCTDFQRSRSHTRVAEAVF